MNLEPTGQEKIYNKPRFTIYKSMMTVQDLISYLQRCDPNEQVYGWDEQEGNTYAITTVQAFSEKEKFNQPKGVLLS